jgi:YEATS family
VKKPKPIDGIYILEGHRERICLICSPKSLLHCIKALQISETGWGEFESKIYLHFHDASEGPVEINHLLKLYPSQSQIPTSKRPVIHEFYDELVFQDPTEAFYKKLVAGPEKEAPINPLAEYFPIYSETEEMQKLNAAQRWIQQEIDQF